MTDSQINVPKVSERRKKTSTFIQSGTQFKIAVGSFALAFVVITAYLGVFLWNVDRLILNLSLSYSIDPEAIAATRDSLAETAWVTMGLSTLLFSILLMVSLWKSHQIFGPKTPILRLIEQLKEGKYQARGQLRAGDEYQEVMSALNELAQTLESKSGNT